MLVAEHFLQMRKFQLFIRASSGHQRTASVFVPRSTSAVALLDQHVVLDTMEL